MSIIALRSAALYNNYVYDQSFSGGFGQEFVRLGLSLRFSELEISVKELRSGAVFGGRLQRPSPCHIRSAPRRERRRMLSETSEKRFFSCISGGVRPGYSWILGICRLELERNKGQQLFQIGIISKFASKLLPDDAFFMTASKRLPYRSCYCCAFSVRQRNAQRKPQNTAKETED